MDTQKGDNPNIFILELLPLFCQKIVFLTRHRQATRAPGSSILVKYTDLYQKKKKFRKVKEIQFV